MGLMDSVSELAGSRRGRQPHRAQHRRRHACAAWWRSSSRSASARCCSPAPRSRCHRRRHRHGAARRCRNATDPPFASCASRHRRHRPERSRRRAWRRSSAPSPPTCTPRDDRALLATAVAAVALTTLFIGAGTWLLGFFRLSRFIRFIPYPVDRRLPRRLRLAGVDRRRSTPSPAPTLSARRLPMLTEPTMPGPHAAAPRPDRRHCAGRSG